MIDKIKAYGLDVFMYVQKGGSHGGTLYYNAMSSIISILHKNYTRTLTPKRVHKGIMTSRATSAYWLEASALSATLSPNLSKTAPPPAVLDATWTGNLVTLDQAKGVSEVKIRWKAAATTGPGEGKPGDQLSVKVNGKTTGPYTLKESLLALVDRADLSDLQRLTSFISAPRKRSYPLLPINRLARSSTPCRNLSFKNSRRSPAASRRKCSSLWCRSTIMRGTA